MSMSEKYRKELAGKVDKLPKWAQYYIHSLEGEARELRRQIDEMCAVEPTNTYWAAHLAEGWHPLPLDSFIRFTPEGTYDDNYVDVRLEPKGLLIMGTWPLKIHVAASNRAYIVSEGPKEGESSNF